MQLSIEEVKKLDSNSYQIIDIRSEEEVAHGAIKGALNIQAEEIESDERVLHDKKLVIVCSPCAPRWTSSSTWPFTTSRSLCRRVWRIPRSCPCSRESRPPERRSPIP